MTIKLILKVCSAAGLVVLAFIGLAPQKFVPRSGLGWEIDHFVGYFVFTSMFCLAWPRPIVVGTALMGFAVLLEGLQAFTPDRHADLQTAFYSVGGVLTAALVAELFIRAPRRLNGRALLMPQRFRAALAPFRRGPSF